MADISINLFNHKLSNPIMPAAGPNCRNGEILQKASQGGAGGLVMKTISVKPAPVPYPNIISVGNNSLLNAELWSEIPYQDYLEHEYSKAKSTQKFLMASIGYSAEELAFLGPLLEKTGMVDAIEFSIHYLGSDFTPVVNSAKALRNAVKLPILAKISPGFPNIEQLVKMLEPHIDGFIAVNSLPSTVSFKKLYMYFLLKAIGVV